MNETDLKIFVESTEHYFSFLTGEPAQVGVPYVKGDEVVILEYTGLIGISGDRKGCVYITTPRDMVAALVNDLLGVDPEAEILRDMVGEMANTISGNARKEYGEGFMISVPVILQGAAAELSYLKTPTYIFPITWKNFKSFLVVGIQ